MSRFVMLSFAFMGWTFYELSGGSDFAPPERPQPALVAEAKPSTEYQVTAASLVTQPVMQPVKKPVLQPRVANTTRPKPDRPLANPNLRSEVAMAQITAIGNQMEFGLTPLEDQGTDAGIQLASLSGGLATLTEGGANPIVDTPQADLMPTTADIRHVTASRVNMRSGPGTNYPVITQLRQDAAVEVVGDKNTGWLHLRVVEGETIGWIAASLISKKRP